MKGRSFTDFFIYNMKEDKIYKTKQLKRLKQSLCQNRINELKKRATISELIFKGKLEMAGIKFIFQKGFIEGNNMCIADFYLPKPYRLVIEIDGEYHNLPAQQKRDLIKNQYYRDRGFRVKHIKNEDVEKFDVTTLIKQCDAKYVPHRKCN